MMRTIAAATFIACAGLTAGRVSAAPSPPPLRLVFPVPTPSPGLPPVTGTPALDFGDPGPSSIERATHVEPAIFPRLPALPDSTPIPAADAIARSATLVGVGDAFVGIALNDAVALALARNTDLAVSQANRRVASYQIVSDRGAYDVNFQLVPSYSHGTSASTNPLITGPNGGPITQDILGVSSTFAGLLPNGANYNVSLIGERVTTNSLASAYDPYYATSVQVGLTQPLLRNRSIDEARRRLLVDRFELRASDAASYAAAQTTILNVVDAYWNLVYAWQSVAVDEAALRQAELQAQSNGRQVIRGRVAASDVVEATAQVSAYQGQVATALQNVEQQQVGLKNLILGNRGDATWNANLVPISAPEAAIPEPQLAATVTRALLHRPEIAQLASERGASSVDVAYARDQLKPQLDFGVTVNPTGLAGAPNSATNNPFVAQIGEQMAAINALTSTVNGATGANLPAAVNLLPNSPVNQNGSFGTSVRSLFDFRFPTYSVSLTLGIPIGNHIARGALGVALAQDQSLRVQQTALEQSIAADAASVIQTLRTDAALLVSTRDERQALQQVYLSELRRIAVGRSTEFLVLERLTALANARGTELQAQANYSKALANYRFVTGDLVQSSGVDLAKLGTTTLDASRSPSSAVPGP